MPPPFAGAKTLVGAAETVAGGAMEVIIGVMVGAVGGAGPRATAATRSWDVAWIDCPSVDQVEQRTRRREGGKEGQEAVAEQDLRHNAQV